MPNRVHGIIVIEDNVGTGHALSLHEKTEQPPRHFRFRNQGKNTVSAMMGSFKSAVTNNARKINPDFGWQTRFHDHIIRSHEEFLRISNYIVNNPANWEDADFINNNPIIFDSWQKTC